MIKLTELIRNEIPARLYHGTFDPLIPHIQQYGLIPHGKMFRNYEDIEWGVYLSNDYGFAGNMVECSENENIPEKWFEEIVIIVINTTDLDPTKFDFDPNITMDELSTQKSYIYRGIIPPTNIEEIVDFT